MTGTSEGIQQRPGRSKVAGETLQMERWRKPTGGGRDKKEEVGTRQDPSQEG